LLRHDALSGQQQELTGDSNWLAQQNRYHHKTARHQRAGGVLKPPEQAKISGLATPVPLWLFGI
jgi:hypothetical protein